MLVTPGSQRVKRKQPNWLFTKHNQGAELEAGNNNSSELQGGGLEPKTTKLQV